MEIDIGKEIAKAEADLQILSQQLANIQRSIVMRQGIMRFLNNLKAEQEQAAKEVSNEPSHNADKSSG